MKLWTERRSNLGARGDVRTVSAVALDSDSSAFVDTSESADFRFLPSFVDVSRCTARFTSPTALHQSTLAQDEPESSIAAMTLEQDLDLKNPEHPPPRRDEGRRRARDCCCRLRRRMLALAYILPLTVSASSQLTRVRIHARRPIPKRPALRCLLRCPERRPTQSVIAGPRRLQCRFLRHCSWLAGRSPVSTARDTFAHSGAGAPTPTSSRLSSAAVHPHPVLADVAALGQRDSEDTMETAFSPRPVLPRA
uniref:Uncharacterized protein n=1 Tax=Mycena chlorophos TaxID=658473 RepID=A0ABQ0L8M4_MYCCL|nr:predicted protein [Mycena chlorophos]